MLEKSKQRMGHYQARSWSRRSEQWRKEEKCGERQVRRGALKGCRAGGVRAGGSDLPIVNCGGDRHIPKFEHWFEVDRGKMDNEGSSGGCGNRKGCCAVAHGNAGQPVVLQFVFLGAVATRYRAGTGGRTVSTTVHAHTNSIDHIHTRCHSNVTCRRRAGAIRSECHLRAACHSTPQDGNHCSPRLSTQKGVRLTHRVRLTLIVSTRPFRRSRQRP